MPTVDKQAGRQNERSTATQQSHGADLGRLERAGHSILQTAPAVEQSRRDEIERAFDGLRDLSSSIAGTTAVAERAARETQLDVIAEGQRHEAVANRRLAEDLGAVLTDAAKQVRDQDQSRERDAGPDAIKQSQQRAREQAVRLVELVDHVERALQSRSQEMRNQQAVEQRRVAQALASGAPGSDLLEVTREQDNRQSDRARADARLAGHVRRSTELIMNRLTSQQASALRDELGEPAAELDADAIQRIHDRARAVKVASTDAMAFAVKGQLAEELNDQVQAARIAAKGESDLGYIAGHRLTNADGASLTDGIVVRGSADSTQEISDAYEVKAGKSSARELTYTLERDRSDEVVRHARDLAVAALADRQRLASLKLSTEDQRALAAQRIAERRENATGAEAAALNREDVALVRAHRDELDALVDEHLTELLKPSVQRQPGQLAATSERLHQQRIFVDGVELRRREEDARGRTTVHAVVPRGTHTAAGGEQLSHTEQDLRRAARAAANLIRSWTESQ